MNGGAPARACDFWRGVGREGDGGLKASSADADGERWTGGMGNDYGDGDDDSDGGGGGFDFGGQEDGHGHDEANGDVSNTNIEIT